jgi:hypothetical protein
VCVRGERPRVGVVCGGVGKGGGHAPASWPWQAPSSSSSPSASPALPAYAKESHMRQREPGAGAPDEREGPESRPRPSGAPLRASVRGDFPEAQAAAAAAAHRPRCGVCVSWVDVGGLAGGMDAWKRGGRRRGGHAHAGWGDLPGQEPCCRGFSSAPWLRLRLELTPGGPKGHGQALYQHIGAPRGLAHRVEMAALLAGTLSKIHRCQPRAAG